MRFSPGIAQGCIELLNILLRQNLTFEQISTSFSRLGGMPITQIVETSQTLNWIKMSEGGTAEVTAAGNELAAIPDYSGQIRQALLGYIDITHPPWVQNAPYGRSRVMNFAGSEITQMFTEADLAEGLSDETIAFWDALAARARGLKHQRLNEIGRAGERLTIEREKQRTGSAPEWVAIENNADGYDILSVLNKSDTRKLSIEVKASTQGNAARFFLSRNEWEWATDASFHVFHLWDLTLQSSPKLAVVSVDKMEQHVSVDQGGGKWENIQIPFSSFAECFE